MKRQLGVLCAFTLVFSVGLGGQTPANEKQLIELERSVLGAFAKKDVAGFRRHLAEDAFGIDASTGVVKATDWERMMKDIVIDSWNIDNVRVHWANKDTAILTYRWMAKGTFMGQPLPNLTWASSVWVFKNGAWKAQFHQESIPMPTPAKK